MCFAPPPPARFFMHPLSCIISCMAVSFSLYKLVCATSSAPLAAIAGAKAPKLNYSNKLYFFFSISSRKVVYFANCPLYYVLKVICILNQYFR